MSTNKSEIEAYALNSLREYLIYNDIEINNKDELIECYEKMEAQGYFWRAIEGNAMNIVNDVLKKLANAYVEDKNIIENDLIFMGARKVIEKMEQMKNKRKR